MTGLAVRSPVVYGRRLVQVHCGSYCTVISRGVQTAMHSGLQR